VFNHILSVNVSQRASQESRDEKNYLLVEKAAKNYEHIYSITLLNCEEIIPGKMCYLFIVSHFGPYREHVFYTSPSFKRTLYF
jgi:hypothetical protein